jgi:hypothetical protein
MTNGRSIHSFLTGGYICGIPTKVDPTLSDTQLPDCVSDGVADCPLSGDLIHADQLDVPFVFLNSCTRMVTGGYTDMATDSDFPVHVGLNLLQTASSLIGTYRPIDGLPKENALHYNLLRAGYGPLERCYLLNRNAEACNLKSHPYVHFGHPARHVSDPLDQEYDVEYTVDKRSISLTATDIESPLIDVCLPIPEGVSAPENRVVKNRTGKYESAFLNYSLFVEDNRLRLLVYSWGRLEAERLDFDVEVPDRGKKRMIAESLDNLQNLRELTISDSKLGGQIENLKTSLVDSQIWRRISTLTPTPTGRICPDWKCWSRVWWTARGACYRYSEKEGPDSSRKTTPTG